MFNDDATAPLLIPVSKLFNNGHRSLKHRAPTDEELELEQKQEELRAKGELLEDGLGQEGVEYDDNGQLKITEDNAQEIEKKLLEQRPLAFGGVIDCKWHPNQPWLFTAGADGRVLLWS